MPCRRLLLVLALLALGCRPSASSRPLQDTDPIFVIPAVADLSDNRADDESTDELFGLLTHPDAAVRFAAANKLRNRGLDNDAGYRFWQDAVELNDAAEQWRKQDR